MDWYFTLIFFFGYMVSLVYVLSIGTSIGYVWKNLDRKGGLTFFYFKYKFNVIKMLHDHILCNSTNIFKFLKSQIYTNNIYLVLKNILLQNTPRSFNQTYPYRI